VRLEGKLVRIVSQRGGTMKGGGKFEKLRKGKKEGERTTRHRIWKGWGGGNWTNVTRCGHHSEGTVKKCLGKLEGDLTEGKEMMSNQESLEVGDSG